MILLLAVAWGVRELVPVVAKRLRAAERLDSEQARTLADSSGAFQPIPNEQLATRREVIELRDRMEATEKRFAAAVRRLETRTAELDKVIAVLKDRAGMAD